MFQICHRFMWGYVYAWVSPTHDSPLLDDGNVLHVFSTDGNLYIYSLLRLNLLKTLSITDNETADGRNIVSLSNGQLWILKSGREIIKYGTFSKQYQL
jgi:hypothetical protein